MDKFLRHAINLYRVPRVGYSARLGLKISTNNCYVINYQHYQNLIFLPRTSQIAVRPLTTENNPGLHNVNTLEKVFERFERRCYLTEMVDENDFNQIFNFFKIGVQRLETEALISSQVKGNLSLLAATLLRCCGRLMFNVAPKKKEQYLGQVWEFIKGGAIELDISLYNSLIRSMNENQTEYDPDKMLKEINDSGLSPDAVTYQRLIQQCCQTGNIEKATALLQTMKELEFNLNENIFASLIIGYSYQEKPPVIKQLFDLMKASGIEPNGKSLAAAIQVVAKRLPTPDAEEELESLSQQIKNDDIQFSIDDSIDILSSLGKHKENKTAVKIINSIIETVGYQPSNKRLLRALFMSDLEELASTVYWSRKPSDRSLAMGNVGNFYLKLLVETNRSVEFCIRECDKLISHGYQNKPYHSLFYNAAQSGNLQLVREALKRMDEDFRQNHTMYWPLIAQANNENELVEVLKNDLDHDMRPTQLLETFSEWVWPKFSENYERLFELNKELKFNNAILVTSFLRFAVREGRVNEAIELLTSIITNMQEPETNETVDSKSDDPDILDEEDSYVGEESNFGTNRQGRSRKSIIGSLLNQLADQTKDPQLVKKAFEVCLIPGQPVDEGSAMPLIKAHLLNEDFKGAIETFLQLAIKYRITPRKGELIKYCLENKEPESLQKIIDVLTQINGQSDALFDLAYCCVCVKKLKQAQKILTSQSARFIPQRIYRTCNYLLNSDRIENLEDFVILSQNVFGIDQEYLYSLLIEGYKKNKDGKRALALYNRMQEDDIQPSKTILLRLAEVLEESGFDVPFQKPVLSSTSSQNIVRPDLRSNFRSDNRRFGRI